MMRNRAREAASLPTKISVLCQIRRRAVVTGGRTFFLPHSPQPARRAMTWQHLFVEVTLAPSFELNVFREARPTKNELLSPSLPLLPCQLLTNSCKKLNWSLGESLTSPRGTSDAALARPRTRRRPRPRKVILSPRI